MKIITSIGTLLLLVNDTLILRGCNLSAILPRSTFTKYLLTELEDMHKKIVQKCAPIIDGFSALNIFEVSYVEHKLKEIKNDFRKDYERNHQYVKFFKRVNKQGKTEGNADVKGGAKGRKKK